MCGVFCGIHGLLTIVHRPRSLYGRRVVRSLRGRVHLTDRAEVIGEVNSARQVAVQLVFGEIARPPDGSLPTARFRLKTLAKRSPFGFGHLRKLPARTPIRV